MNKSLWRVGLLGGMLVSGLLACTRTPAADSERGALEAAINRWTAAVNARDVSALTATMTEDVNLLGDATAVTGREAAIQALREEIAQGTLTATSREITIANDVAWHIAGLTQIQKNGIVQARGDALEIWKREKGSWRLHRRMTGAICPDVSVTRPSTDEPVLDRPKD